MSYKGNIIYEGYFNDKTSDSDDIVTDIEQLNQSSVGKSYRFGIKINTKSGPKKTDEQYIKLIKSCCYPLGGVISIKVDSNPFEKGFIVRIDNASFDIDDVFDFLYMLCNREICQIDYLKFDNGHHCVYSKWLDVFADISHLIVFINYLMDKDAQEFYETYQEIISNKRALAIFFQTYIYLMDMKVQRRLSKCSNITDELIKSLNIDTTKHELFSINMLIKKDGDYLKKYELLDEGIEFNGETIQALKDDFFYVSNGSDWILMNKQLMDDRIIILRKESFNSNNESEYKEHLRDRFFNAFR